MIPVYQLITPPPPQNTPANQADPTMALAHPIVTQQDCAAMSQRQGEGVDLDLPGFRFFPLRLQPRPASFPSFVTAFNLVADWCSHHIVKCSLCFQLNEK